jgi:hypothetical protein
VWCFAWADEVVFANDYFANRPFVNDEPGTYADLDAPTVHNESYEWQHQLGDIVTAVAATGLRLELLHEHDFTLFRRFPWLLKDGFDTYRFPPERPRFPLMYSLKARKPDR